MTQPTMKHEPTKIPPEALEDEPYVEADRCHWCAKQTDELFTYANGFVCMRCLPKLLQSTTRDYLAQMMDSHTHLVLHREELSAAILKILDLKVDPEEFRDITRQYVRLQALARDQPYKIRKHGGMIHVSL